MSEQTLKHYSTSNSTPWYLAFFSLLYIFRGGLLKAMILKNEKLEKLVIQVSSGLGIHLPGTNIVLLGEVVETQTSFLRGRAMDVQRQDSCWVVDIHPTPCPAPQETLLFCLASWTIDWARPCDEPSRKCMMRNGLVWLCCHLIQC